MQDNDQGSFSPSSYIVNIPDDCGYEVKFEYDLCLKDPGVPAVYVDWCTNNCSGRWGWWFDRDNARLYSTRLPDRTQAYLSFEYEEDLIIFTLTHDISNQHTK